MGIDAISLNTSKKYTIDLYSSWTRITHTRLDVLGRLLA